MSLNIRPYREQDAERVLTVWNKWLPYDPLTRELLREKTLGDRDFDPDLTLILEDNGEIVGFGQGLVRPWYEPGVGWIKLFAIQPGRYLDVGPELLRPLEEGLKNKGAEFVQVFDSAPNYLMPGIDPRYTEMLVFFQRAGYTRYDDTSNMDAPLEGASFDTSEREAKLRESGIEVKRADLADRERVLEFVREKFIQWVPEVDATFENDPVSLHVALVDGRVVAFSAYDANNRGTGWFGPMGTDPSLRGKGVGAVLYLRCLRDIQNQGHKKAIIPWVGPIAFYFRTSGAVVSRVFWQYRKELG